MLEALGEIETGTPADRALHATFKRARDLGGGERFEVGDTVYRLIRAKRRVDDLLFRALKAEGKKADLLEQPILERLRLLTLFVASGVGLDEVERQDPYAFGRVPRLFERIAGGRLPAVKRSHAEELGIALSLPDWMIERLLASLGEARTIAIGQALGERAPVTLRVNTLLADRDLIAAALRAKHQLDTQPTRLAPDGLILGTAADVQGWEIFREGMVELQDEGSQLVALATGAGPKEIVLDACAGAGGKTLAIAAAMKGTGRLVALDPEPRKIEELKRRARRARITNLETIATDLEALPQRFAGTFDRVLVDAPCTGSGVFRRHPDARWRVSAEDLAAQVRRQKRLLISAAGALKPGGRLVYATCSVLHEENEAIVLDALANDPRLEAASLEEGWGVDLARTLGASSTARIGPGPTDRDPDGFFVAALRRS